MNIQQIRNATLKINYGGSKFLVDPWLQKKGTAFIAPSPWVSKNVPSPLTELKMSVKEIVSGIDAIIVTHIHPDHFDRESADMLDKSIPVFAQNEGDKKRIMDWGFKDVTVLSESGSKFGAVELVKVEGMHGESPMRAAGEVCGVVMKAPNEKTLYIAGDTVYYRGIEKNIKAHNPSVIVVNACAATLLVDGVNCRLIMNKEDVLMVCKMAPKAKIIASHMETVNHASLNRAELRAYLAMQGVGDMVIIPEDGEICML